MAKVSCRKAFTSTLLELAKDDANIYAVATDSRGSVTLSGFADELPEQFVEAGIAEQNAVGIGAGLAKCGKTVFVTGPACFLAARAYEQVKVDVAYNKTNVKIVGVSAGVSYGPLGGTHVSLHDFAGMRSLPNLTVLAPSDDIQARALTKLITATEGPVYMRMGRGDVEQVYPDGTNFEIGKSLIVREGVDVTLIACGEMVYNALQAAIGLAEQGVNARVIDMFTIKPLDEDAIIKAANDTKAIITIEEHSIYGGLGEAVAHITAKTGKTPVHILGFPDEEIKIGKSNELFEYYGLGAAGIATCALKALEG